MSIRTVNAANAVSVEAIIAEMEDARDHAQVVRLEPWGDLIAPHQIEIISHFLRRGAEIPKLIISARCRAAWAHARTQGVRGNARMVLTDEQRAAIAQRFRDGESLSSISKAFKVSWQTARNAVRQSQ